MLSENGIVIDDGVFARLADCHYLVGTTSAKADHITDWLKASFLTGAGWLHNVDGLGRPKKMMKCSSIADLVREADKAMDRLNAQRARSLGADDERSQVEAEGELDFAGIVLPRITLAIWAVAPNDQSRVDQDSEMTPQRRRRHAVRPATELIV